MVQACHNLTLTDLREMREEITHLAAIRGARNVGVFGSVARDEAIPASDVDFLVEMEQRRSALDISELILVLEEILGRRVVVVTIRRPSPLTERIEREALPCKV